MIVPAYGNWPDVEHCLKLLESQDTHDFRILIADDGSPERPPEAVRNSSGYVRDENAGFGANCNRAARIAIAGGATHLLFLNSDTTFGTGFLSGWHSLTARMPEAILGPLIYYSSKPGVIWSSGGKLTMFTPFVRSRREFVEITEVDTMTGCAMLVPAEAFTALGGFDPAYFMYFEDFDLTLRAKAAGVRSYIAPGLELRVWHHVSGSSREGVWRKHEWMAESTLIFIRRHYQGVSKGLCIGLSFLHLALTAALALPALPRPKRLWNALSRGFSR